MTPRERAERIIERGAEHFGVAKPRIDIEAWLIDSITTAIQEASNEQLERGRAREEALKQIAIDEAYNHAAHVNGLVDLCHGRAMDAGWWDSVDINDPNVAGAKIALIHSEVSEALEGMRKGLMDDHLPHRKMEEVELADAIIRICDYAGARGFDLGGAIVDKLEYNRSRKDHTREHRAGEGGKKI